MTSGKRGKAVYRRGRKEAQGEAWRKTGTKQMRTHAKRIMQGNIKPYSSDFLCDLCG
jgi:ribosomal protein RSM22 (predicted rRNA methylase)